MTIKDYIYQTIIMIITISIIIVIIGYLFSGVFKNIKDKIVNSPYPFIYAAPTSVNSKTIYDGGSLNEFTKILDNLADRLD